MKLMAIDYGTKRVGVASTDESGQFALPRMVFENDGSLLEKILEFKKKKGIEKVVIGESRNLDNSPNPILEDIKRFKEDLENMGVPAVLHPEMFTTMEARRLQGNTEMTDASAAALILKSYIDSKKG
jgi:putative Holliday junction resolvase